MFSNKVVSDSSLSESFKNRFLHLADSGIGFDCEFVVGHQNVVVKGHKLVFAAASEVFQAMFYGDLKEEKTVRIEDVDLQGFQGMKKFIYTGEVNFTSAIHALLTYIVAQKYMISQLVSECKYFIKEKLQPTEVLEFYEYCKIHRISEFEELCFEIIENKTDDVVNSNYFVEAEIDTIELILKSPSLKLNSEIEVFVHFERWALAEAKRKNIDKMSTNFNSLKQHIRFLTLSAEEYVTEVEGSVLLTEEEKHAISLNLLKSDSKPIPCNLSLVQQKRNFILTNLEKYQNKLEFKVSIYNRYEYHKAYSFSDIFDGRLIMSCSELSDCDFVYFKIKPENTSQKKKFLMMKSKLRVIAEKRCDDLYFENECKILMLPQTSNDCQQEVIFAAIPIIKLRRECYLKGTGEVSIAVSFAVELIK